MTIVRCIIIRVSVIDVFPNGSGVGPNPGPHDLLPCVAIVTPVFGDPSSQGVRPEPVCICQQKECPRHYAPTRGSCTSNVYVC